MAILGVWSATSRQELHVKISWWQVLGRIDAFLDTVPRMLRAGALSNDTDAVVWFFLDQLVVSKMIEQWWKKFWNNDGTYYGKWCKMIDTCEVQGYRFVTDVFPRLRPRQRQRLHNWQTPWPRPLCLGGFLQLRFINAGETQVCSVCCLVVLQTWLWLKWHPH